MRKSTTLVLFLICSVDMCNSVIQTHFCLQQNSHAAYAVHTNTHTRLIIITPHHHHHRMAYRNNHQHKFSIYLLNSKCKLFWAVFSFFLSSTFISIIFQCCACVPVTHWCNRLFILFIYSPFFSLLIDLWNWKAANETKKNGCNKLMNGTVSGRLGMCHLRRLLENEIEINEWINEFIINRTPIIFMSHFIIWIDNLQIATAHFAHVESIEWCDFGVKYILWCI